jgi:malic enzyme
MASTVAKDKDLNLAIVGLGGAGLATLRHMITDLRSELRAEDSATVTVIDEAGTPTASAAAIRSPRRAISTAWGWATIRANC